jgi:DNA-binding GntR family transcriptional regulator
MPTKRKLTPRAAAPDTNAGPWANLTTLWRRYESDPVAADAIYTTLREAILDGVLPAGERLAELQLAALFNRSRTPVREAILRLEAEHLAERSGRRGFVVGGITREEILEVYAVREVIDGLAARLAAQGCLPTDLDHLAWLNRRMWKAAEQHDQRLLVELNIEFHEAIARASRNALLLQFMRQIHDWVRRFSDTTFAYRGRAAEALKEHDALLEALGRHDSDAAERIARAHMARANEVRIAMQQSVSPR